MTVTTKTKPNRSPRGSTARGVSFSALAGFASLAAGVLLLPVVISVIGPSAYGAWLFLLAAASFLFCLDLGIGTALIHYLSRSRSGDQESQPDRLVSTAHAWAAAAAVGAIGIFLLVAWSYAEEALHHVDSEELAVLVTCGVVLLASMCIRPMSSVLFGAGYLHLERRNQIIGVAIRIVGTLGACSLSSSVAGVAVAETLALVAPTVLSTGTAARLKIGRLRFSDISRQELKRMFSYSMGAFSVSMVGALVLQFGTLIVGVLGAPSQVTYFNAAFRIYTSVRQVIGWLTDPFRSVFSRLYVTDHLRARAVLYDLLFVSFITSAVGGMFLLISLPPFLMLWLGDSVPLNEVLFTASTLIAGLILNALHIPLIPASDAAGRPGAFLLHQVLWLLSYAGLSLLLFPLMGIAGVALAMALPLPALEFAYLMQSRKTVHLDFEAWFRRVIKPSLPVLLLGLVGAVATRFDFIQGIPLGALLVGILYVIASIIALFLTRERWAYRSIFGSFRLKA